MREGEKERWRERGRERESVEEMEAAQSGVSTSPADAGLTDATSIAAAPNLFHLRSG